MACKVTGGAHVETPAGESSAVIGDETVYFTRIECSACGEGIRNQIHTRIKNDDGKGKK